MLRACVMSATPISTVSQIPYHAKERKDIRLNFCRYKAWILVHTKPLYSNAKLFAFWRNTCILHDTGLELSQATVSSIKRIV